MIRFFIRAIVTCLLLGTLSAPAYAHPHVWIDLKTNLIFNEAGELAALKINWTFDEFYSAFAVEEFKKDASGGYAASDLEKLATLNLTNLRDYQYFTDVLVAGKPVKTGIAHDGLSTWDAKSGLLTLNFVLPLATPVRPDAKTPLSFRIYDPSFYIAIDYVKDNPITMAGGPHDGCKTSTDIPDPETTWTGLPESAFTGVGGAKLGLNFASTTTLICDTP